MSDVKQHDAIQGEIVHEYDGILEADNALPRWWLGIFVATVVFAVAYWFVFHVYGWFPLPRDAWASEVAEAAARGGGPVTEESLAAILGDEATVERGRGIYVQNCVACHAERGEGRIGPNLTDHFWIHGGSAIRIHQTIAEGVPAKGMPTWAPMLGRAGTQAVTAFIVSIRGTHVPGKEPQGERWEPE